jgi:hypothetical protein
MLWQNFPSARKDALQNEIFSARPFSTNRRSGPHRFFSFLRPSENGAAGRKIPAAGCIFRFKVIKCKKANVQWAAFVPAKSCRPVGGRFYILE